MSSKHIDVIILFFSCVCADVVAFVSRLTYVFLFINLCRYNSELYKSFQFLRKCYNSGIVFSAAVLRVDEAIISNLLLNITFNLRHS